jgi:hypothetical protein
VRFDPKNLPPSVPGPMPHFGPFDSRWDALLAACPLILSQPRATAGRNDDTNYSVRWRVSNEYCAWLYYTPDEKYEMSMLVESTDPIPPGQENERGCKMPALVDDKRYPPRSLKYIYIIHNHPASLILTKKDVLALRNAASFHGKFVETKEGRIPLRIVAFFANSYDPGSPVCEGFFEYSFGSTEVVKWTRDGQGRWRREVAGTVTWIGGQDFRID